jgi:hypothetical protein
VAKPAPIYLPIRANCTKSPVIDILLEIAIFGWIELT